MSQLPSEKLIPLEMRPCSNSTQLSLQSDYDYCQEVSDYGIFPFTGRTVGYFIVNEFSITSVGSTETADLAVLTRPNCSLSETGRLLFFCVMSLFSLVVAVSFAFMGAWLVFPFVGLEVFGLGWALYHVSCHTGDYECIVVSGDDVIVETRSYKTIRQVKLQRHWVQVIVNAGSQGMRRVWLQACGKEVEVGRFFDDDGRLKLSRQIEGHTGAGYK